MSEASDTMGILHQNLIDAGIYLPDLVHNGQKQIDCPDFLVYSIYKNILNRRY